MKKITNGSVINVGNISNILNVLQNPSKTLSNKGETVEVYHAVAGQPDIFSAIQNYNDAIANMDFVFADPFLQDYFSKKNRIQQLAKYAAAARDYGLSIIEVVEYGDFNGKIVPLKLDLSPIEKFHFDTLRQLRLKSNTNPLGILVHEQFPNKFLLLQNDATYSNPYGVALLDKAYWLAVGLNGNFEFMLQFAEDDGRDKWVGKYQPGSSEQTKDDLLNMLVNLRNNGVAIIPEGSDVEPKDYKGRASSTDLYKTINELLLRKVEKLWYGTDLTMQVEGKGSYASSKSGILVREDALTKGKNLTLDAIEQLVLIINNINGTTFDSSCTISAKNSTTKEEAEIDQIYFSMGLKPTTEFFKKRGYEDAEFTLVDKSPDPNNQQFSQGNNEQLQDLFDFYKTDSLKNS